MMPGTLTRMAESFRQTLGMKAGTDKDWRPTSNARNLAMIKEAKDFALQLKKLHRELSALDKSVEANLGTVRGVLASPLPKAYSEDAEGRAMPVDSSDRKVGVGVNIDVLTAAGAEMRSRLQTEVLHPLEQWLAAYRSIKERNKKVMELRLDLDTKRRNAMTAHEKHAKLQAKNYKYIEASTFKVQTEDDKVNRMTIRYQEVEAEVFNALLTLIRDTVVLREYAAASLAILQRCFTLAWGAFDLTTAVPLPMLPSPASLPAPYSPPAYRTTADSDNSPSFPSPLAASHSARLTGSAGGAVPTPVSPVVTSSPAQVPPRAPPSPNADSATPPSYEPPRAVVDKSPVPAPPAPAEAAVPTPASKSLKTPEWYNEAKKNAGAPAAGDDSDVDSPNPFEHKAAAPNPFSPATVDSDDEPVPHVHVRAAPAQVPLPRVFLPGWPSDTGTQDGATAAPCRCS